MSRMTADVMSASILSFTSFVPPYEACHFERDTCLRPVQQATLLCIIQRSFDLYTESSLRLCVRRMQNAITCFLDRFFGVMQMLQGAGVPGQQGRLPDAP